MFDFWLDPTVRGVRVLIVVFHGQRSQWATHTGGFDGCELFKGSPKETWMMMCCLKCNATTKVERDEACAVCFG